MTKEKVRLAADYEPNPGRKAVNDRSCKSRALATVITFFLVALAAPLASTEGGFDAAMVFSVRCATCHTIGDGPAIGPDLSDVTERRERPWLISFIRSSQTMILAGDVTANELFERYDRTTMPDHPYADHEIESLLTLIEQGGPAQKASLRLAKDATPDEIDAGRDLFLGRTSREVACASCHSIQQGAMADRVFLGGSLHGVFARYHDLELDAKLAEPASTCPRALPPDESFLVRAYLRQVEVSAGAGSPLASAFPLLAGVAGLILVAGRRRRGDGPPR